MAELGPDGAELSSASSTGPPPPPPPVHLDAAAIHRLYLGTDLLHRVLPNLTVVQDWQPYKLLPSNMDVLLKKDIDWVVDDEEAPSVASLCTFPIRVPIGDDWYYLNIDMFGKDLSQVRRQYLAHLRRHTAGLRGSVMCQLFLEPALWAPMVELCRSVLRVELVKEYTDQCVVESDVV
uniref:N-acetyltransferase 16 n=1 Tax=Gadus morhua TaxID=8049 RepID=A0A8C5D1D3_GADMO